MIYGAIKHGEMMARRSRDGCVTALPVDNESTNDIDYLIVTKPGRLWCRSGNPGSAVGTATGVEVCPFLILENAPLINRWDVCRPRLPDGAASDSIYTARG
jgi:hypothetical protein